MVYHKVTTGRLTNRYNLTDLIYIESWQQLATGRRTNPYRTSEVGLYADVICYHAFTAGRLTNRIHRRNRNVARSVTWSPEELNQAASATTSELAIGFLRVI
jgi:hypothetical protein